MKSTLSLSAIVAVLATLPLPAQAADLPAIKAGGRNVVPECVTPGRLHAFLKARNPDLDGRYERIGADCAGDKKDVAALKAFFPEAPAKKP